MKFDTLVKLFRDTHKELQRQAARSVDIGLVVRNWLFGCYIVEFENGGAERSELYGKKLIERLSNELTVRMGKGFSKRSLDQCRRFYECNKEITQTVSAQSLEAPSGKGNEIQKTVSDEFFTFTASHITLLSSHFTLGWSHYVILLTIDNAEEHRFYEIEAAQNNWSVRELKRQIESLLYERLALSRDKDKLKELSQRGQLVGSADDIIKNPYVLDFSISQKGMCIRSVILKQRSLTNWNISFWNLVKVFFLKHGSNASPLMMIIFM